jgi:general stress protein 26
MSEQENAHDQNHKELSGQEAYAKMAELMDGIRIAMMTTVVGDGTIHARPMAVQEKANFADSGGTLWFLTRSSSETVDEIGQDRHVTLTFAEPKDSKYIALKGMASVSQDRGKIKELWNPMYKAWFPKGEEDPEIAVLRVQVQEGEYWEASSSKLVMMAKYAAAAVTGGSVAVGESGHVSV